jgi:hypothetical protein
MTILDQRIFDRALYFVEPLNERPKARNDKIVLDKTPEKRIIFSYIGYDD